MAFRLLDWSDNAPTVIYTKQVGILLALIYNCLRDYLADACREQRLVNWKALHPSPFSHEPDSGFTTNEFRILEDFGRGASLV